MRYLVILAILSACATVPDGATTDRSLGEATFESDGCPTVQLYNQTTAFDANDIHNMNLAKDGCKRKYGVDSCLIRFYKMAPQTYRAVCKTLEVK